MKKLNAFNLAEILLTLTIVMIISAVALPNLKKNVHNNEFVAGRKKALSMIKQSWGLVILDHRKYIIGNLNSLDDLVNQISAKLNHSGSTCSSSTKCFPKGIRRAAGLTPAGKGFRLDNGMVVFFTDFSQNCTKNVCAKVWVDTNGNEQPNVYGADAYMFTLTPETATTADLELFQES